MMPIQFRPGMPEQINTLADLPILAIDLGFSKTKRSCGLAWRDGSGQLQSESFRFGECTEKVAGVLEEQPRAVLIIEAPLSGMFTSRGNPVERGDFEKAVPGSSPATPRYWYYGAGGAMCLATVFFLRKLLAELQQLPGEAQQTEIILYEGFVTFKPEATGHTSDAQLLLDSFLGPQPRIISVRVPEGQTVVAITEVVAGRNSDSGAPAIIIPSENNAYSVVQFN